MGAIRTSMEIAMPVISWGLVLCVLRIIMLISIILNLSLSLLAPNEPNKVFMTSREQTTDNLFIFCKRESLAVCNSCQSLCHIKLLNLDILQGSFRLCNWLSLRRLVSWINHFPIACWSTFWKSNFKQQLGCRFDMMGNILFFLCFDFCNYICLDISDHFLVLPS